jgi:hypothetical protein
MKLRITRILINLHFLVEQCPIYGNAEVCTNPELFFDFCREDVDIWHLQGHSDLLVGCDLDVCMRVAFDLYVCMCVCVCVCMHVNVDAWHLQGHNDLLVGCDLDVCMHV